MSSKGLYTLSIKEGFSKERGKSKAVKPVNKDAIIPIGKHDMFRQYAIENHIIWFKPKLVAQLMGCSTEHVYDLVKLKKISCIKDGKNIRFKPEDLDMYEKKSYQGEENGTI